MTVFDEADAVARYQVLEKAESKNRQRADDQRLARALIVADAKANLDTAAYKAFLVKIECADSTSRELLKIASAGSADALRRATALRVAKHRARGKVPTRQLLNGQSGHDRELLAGAYRSINRTLSHIHLVTPTAQAIAAAKDAAGAWTRAYEDLKAKGGLDADDKAAAVTVTAPPVTSPKSNVIPLTPRNPVPDMTNAEFEARVAAAAEAKRSASPKVETPDDAGLVAFEFSYSNKAEYEVFAARAASNGVMVPPMENGRGWRTLRLYVSPDVAKVVESKLGMDHVPMWAARGREKHSHTETGTARGFIEEAADAIRNLDEWQYTLDHEPDRFTIDDHVIAGAKEVAEKSAKLYATILQAGRKRSAA